MIKLYTGNLGAGKTLHMVRDLMEQLRRGRTVISNTPIRFKENGKIYESITISDSNEFLKAVINAWNATIAIDELAVFFPANFWNKMSGELIYKFAQSRKMRVDFFGTTQGWGHTIKRLRDLTNAVVLCTRKKWLFPLFSRLKYTDPEGKFHNELNLSRPYVYHGRTLLPEFFRHTISDPKKRKMFELDTDVIYPSEAKRVFEAYNTYFRVKGSALTKMTGIIENYQPIRSNNVELLKEDQIVPQYKPKPNLIISQKKPIKLDPNDPSNPHHPTNWTTSPPDTRPSEFSAIGGNLSGEGEILGK